MRLNPHHYDWYTAQLGQLYFDARRYDKAISTFAGLRELDTALMRVYQAASFAALGRMEDARASVRRALELDPDASLEKWGDVKLAPYGDTGYLEHFRTNLRQAGLPEKPPSSGTDKLAIAVLPFANLSSDPEQQYFAEGIAEDVITGLARFRHLAVVSRNASFRYRGDVDIKKAGQELGAAYLVEGSVRRLGEHLRITAQLIETQTLNHVWAESYDAPGSELFEAQDRLTRKIVATLGGRITDASVHHARLKPPGSLAAYELVLRANALNWDKAEAKVEVQRLLSMALDLEPDYALAHALMAAILVDQATDHARLTPAVFERAMTFASRAVELDKNDSASHSIAGWICLMRGDYDRGAAFIEGALRLNPNNPYAMINRACLHLLSGEPDAAIEVLERVWQVDPYFNPGWVEWYMSLAHFVAGRYAEVQVVVSRASQQSYFTMAVAAASKAALGDIAAARAWTAKALQLRPDCTIRAITSLAPFKLHRHHERLTSALREAGMPEMSWSHEQGEPEKPSIAILPFANLSGDPQQDYFADGVAEDIITELSRFSGLFVIARNSSFFFKGKNLGISAIAEQLGVKFIVEGSVRRSGNQIRVAVQLVDTDTGNEIWAERYDRSIDEIFAVQDEVVRTIVGTLEGRLAKNIAKQSSRKPTSSVLAYELVLQARDYLGTYDVQRAEPLLRKAIELDPGYAQALAWLAMVYWVKYFNDHEPSDINESLRVAKSAVAIDPDDSLCHAQYGYACLFSRQFDLADYHTGRAVELNPADMLSLSLRAHFYCRVGKSERTLEILDEVLRHDPFPPSWYWENRSIALLTLERYAEVIETIRRMQEIFWWDHAYLAVSYLHLGKLKEMKDSVAAAIKKRPDLNIEQMMKGEPYADTGDSERLIKGLRAAGFL